MDPLPYLTEEPSGPFYGSLLLCWPLDALVAVYPIVLFILLLGVLYSVGSLINFSLFHNANVVTA